MNILSHVVTFALGGAVVGLVYHNNVKKMTALVGELIAHVQAGTAEEEAKILPKVKAFVAEHFHVTI